MVKPDARISESNHLFHLRPSRPSVVKIPSPMKPALFLSTLLLPFPLIAHPDPRHTLEHLEEHLADTPDDPNLLREKAGLLLATGHPDLARPVVDQLLAQAPSKPEDLLLDARVCFAKNDAATLTKASALVAAHPQFAPGWNFLARAEDAQGHRDEAIAAKRRYLDLARKPAPGDVLTCASWLSERDRPGDDEAALAVLDQGLAKLGVLTGLHHKAIEIELKLGRPDAALQRIDALTARFRPSVELSLRRADILENAGRLQEAATACNDALALLDALPAKRKQSEAYREQLETITKRKAENLAR
jgi:predicted Zn-dependent protease